MCIRNWAGQDRQAKAGVIMKGSNPLLSGMSGKVGNYVIVQSGDKTIVRQRKMDNSSNTQSQAEHRMQFKATSQGWKTLTEAGRQSYRDLGLRMTGKSGKALTGANCYSSITSTRALLGLPPLATAPALPPQSPMLPSPLFVTAASVRSFLLLAHSAAATGPFLVEAAPYVSAGVASFPKNAFRVCGVLASLMANATDITQLYLSLFTSPPVGAQVAVRLTPLTQTGFRGTAIVSTSFVAATQKEMNADLEERRAKKGRKTQLQLVA